MTTLESAARQALEALQLCANGEDDTMLTRDTLAALREALEQQPKQEPVTWMYSDAEGNNPVPLFTAANRIDSTCEASPLYVAPQPARQWVGLTEVEMTEVANTAETYTESVKLTEAALKAKNT